MAKAPVFLYLIKLFNNDENFYKIGISVHKYCRFYQIMKHGYKCEITYMICGHDYMKFLQLESFLHSNFNELKYTPLRKFGGYRECYNNISVEGYIELLRGLYPFNAPVIKNLPITWR